MHTLWDSDQILSWGKRRHTYETRKVETVVVDSLSGYLEVLEALRTFEDALEVVGRATSTADAVGLVASLEPDLVIMDAGVSLGNAVALAGVLRDCLPDTLIVLTSREDAKQQPSRCLASGAHAFVAKEKLGEQLPRILVSRFPTLFEGSARTTDSADRSAVDS